MTVNGKVWVGVCCATFVIGVFLGAAIVGLKLHLRPAARHDQQIPSAPPPVSDRPNLRPDWWRPQPKFFDVKEHNIMNSLDSVLAKYGYEHLQSAIWSFAYSMNNGWKELPPSTLHALSTDAFATILKQHDYDLAALSSESPSSDSTALKQHDVDLAALSSEGPSSDSTALKQHDDDLAALFSESPSSDSTAPVPNWPAITHLFSKPETRLSGLIYLLSMLVIPNISLDGSGLPKWNLLSPSLAGLAQEIAELRKQRDSEDLFSVWAFEKLRIYALICLYPSIIATDDVLVNQNQQPSTQSHAILRLEKLLVDLLDPYIQIAGEEIEALRNILEIAGRLGACVYKQLQPWGWSWETTEEGIILFPALQIIGDVSGVRNLTEKIQVVGLDYDPEYNMAGERICENKASSVSGSSQPPLPS